MYSKELTAKLHNVAQANDGLFTYAMAVNFAAEHGLKHRSVIAKVKSEGIPYEPKPKRVTKNDEPVIRKAELVEQIEMVLGGASFASLVKASKADLQELANAIARNT